MNIGQEIKKLRRGRDMTQEQLAECLGISPQAVSRWETNLATPDIALLPALANLFDVTTDRLLGVDGANREKVIDTILKKADEHGHHCEAAGILRDGLKTYPSSYRLMDALEHELYASPQEMTDAEPAQIADIFDEAIALGERILAESTDNELRTSAVQTLCYIYSQNGRIEDAVRLAGTMPYSPLSRDNLLSQIYRGDKRYEQYRARYRESAIPVEFYQ